MSRGPIGRWLGLVISVAQAAHFYAPADATSATAAIGEREESDLQMAVNEIGRWIVRRLIRVTDSAQSSAWFHDRMQE